MMSRAGTIRFTCGCWRASVRSGLDDVTRLVPPAGELPLRTIIDAQDPTSLDLFLLSTSARPHSWFKCNAAPAKMVDACI